MFELKNKGDKRECVKCHHTWFKSYHLWNDGEEQYICIHCGTLTPINMIETMINVRFRRLQCEENERAVVNNQGLLLASKFDIYNTQDSTGEIYQLELNGRVIGETSRVKTLRMITKILPKQCQLTIRVQGYSGYNTLKNRIYAIFEGDSLQIITQSTSNIKELTGMPDVTLNTLNRSDKTIFKYKQFKIHNMKLHDTYSVKSNEEEVFRSTVLKDVQNRYFPDKSVSTLGRAIKNESLNDTEYTLEVNTNMSESNCSIIQMGLIGKRSDK